MWELVAGRWFCLLGHAAPQQEATRLAGKVRGRNGLLVL
jgi:hypothetical protein